VGGSFFWNDAARPQEAMFGIWHEDWHRASGLSQGGKQLAKQDEQEMSCITSCQESKENLAWTLPPF
jgi:hypothetical protein